MFLQCGCVLPLVLNTHMAIVMTRLLSANVKKEDYLEHSSKSKFIPII